VPCLLHASSLKEASHTCANRKISPSTEALVHLADGFCAFLQATMPLPVKWVAREKPVTSVKGPNLARSWPSFAWPR
jgi:hypothetical protein